MTNENTECASVWFAILERSLNLGNAARAQEARRKLAELGIEVRVLSHFQPPTSPRSPINGFGEIQA